MYGHYSQIKNKGGLVNGATFQVGSINGSTGTAPGTKSRGFEVGLRHSF